MSRGRGNLAWWTGRISLDLAGLALVFLLIFVVDSTVLCYRFVTHLARCVVSAERRVGGASWWR